MAADQSWLSQLHPAGNVTVAFDSFRSIPDGTWQNNNGAFLAANFALRVPHCSEMSVQIGGSYGLYDWSQRALLVNNYRQWQQQAFLTAGLFCKTPWCSGFNVGLVADYMLNKNFGIFGLNPNIGQGRAQIGYLFSGGNEFGVWGTLGWGSSHKEYSGIPFRFKAINQVSAFWAHYFKNNAYTMLSVGVPYGRSLFFNSGRPGGVVFGGRVNVPLNHCWSVTGHFAYMTARHASGSISPSQCDACNISLGLSYAFGGSSRCGQPYLPIADNSNFLVDTNVSD